MIDFIAKYQFLIICILLTVLFYCWAVCDFEREVKNNEN